MSTTEIVTAPNEVLTTRCKPISVDDINTELKQLADDLIHYLLSHRDDEVYPIGLAAPQLGESVRMFVFYPNPSFREEIGIDVVLNPMISKQKSIVVVEEACLSLPGNKYTVRRAQRLRLDCVNIEGRPRSYKARDLVAQIIQHEIDHLNGILINSLGSPKL